MEVGKMKNKKNGFDESKDVVLFKESITGVGKQYGEDGKIGKGDMVGFEVSVRRYNGGEAKMQISRYIITSVKKNDEGNILSFAGNPIKVGRYSLDELTELLPVIMRAYKILEAEQ